MMAILDRPRDTNVSFIEAGESVPLSVTLKEISQVGAGFDAPFLVEPGDFGGLKRVTAAAYRSMNLNNFGDFSARALESAYDRIIQRTRDETGVALENPERDGYGSEATRLFREEARSAIAAGRNAVSNGVPDVRRRIFSERLQQLADANPDKAERFLLDPGSEALAIAREAREEHQRATAAVDGFTGMVGTIAGGVGSAARDPLQWAGLFLGGGAGAAGSALRNIGQVAAREALINAGMAALQEPAVQAWRAKQGLESGVVPALESVGMAALFGAIAGSVLEGGREGFKALRAIDRGAVERTVSGTATPAEAEAALRALNVDRETIDAVAAAGRAAEADAVLSAPPPGANPAAHGDAMAEAVARAETGSVLPQEPVYPVRAGMTDDAALAVLERNDLGPIGALLELRRDPDLIESALSSRSPAVREAGEVALLGDEAFQLLERSGIDPRFGALVQRAAAEPERQAAFMRDLVDAQPRNLAEAREILGDALAADTARSTATRIGGENAIYDPAAPTNGLSEAALPARPETKADDVMALTPGLDEAGRPALLPRGASERAAAREDWLTDLVKSCKA